MFSPLIIDFLRKISSLMPLQPFFRLFSTKIRQLYREIGKLGCKVLEKRGNQLKTELSISIGESCVVVGREGQWKVESPLRACRWIVESPLWVVLSSLEPWIRVADDSSLSVGVSLSGPGHICVQLGLVSLVSPLVWSPLHSPRRCSSTSSFRLLRLHVFTSSRHIWNYPQ